MSGRILALAGGVGGAKLALGLSHVLPSDALTVAVNTADENAIRTYFATHQAEWSELQGIASPLRSLRQSCPQQVSPGDVARLYDAMAS